MPLDHWKLLFVNLKALKTFPKLLALQPSQDVPVVEQRLQTYRRASVSPKHVVRTQGLHRVEADVTFTLFTVRPRNRRIQSLTATILSRRMSIFS